MEVTLTASPWGERMDMWAVPLSSTLENSAPYHLGSVLVAVSLILVLVSAHQASLVMLETTSLTPEAMDSTPQSPKRVLLA